MASDLHILGDLRKLESISPTSSAAFSPSGLTGLVLWLDASNAGSITQSGGFVSAWADLSVTAANFTQATANIRPAYVASAIGGKPAISFSGSVDGTHGCLVDTGTNLFVGDGTTALTIWTVLRPLVTPDWSMAMTFHGGTNPTSPQLGFATGQPSYQNLFFGGSSASAFGSARCTSSFSIAGGIAYALAITYDGTGSAGYAYYDSNVAQTVVAAGNANSTVPNTIVGANDTSGVLPLLYLAEIAIYSRKLSAAELAQLQTYGNTKYGL